MAGVSACPTRPQSFDSKVGQAFSPVNPAEANQMPDHENSLKPARDAGSSAKAAALQEFRRYPEKILRLGTAEWRYRVLGTASPALLAVPGGELVNDLGFEFALAISDTHRVVYPAYPRVSSIEELADGLCAVLDAEKIEQAAILGASFGGSVAQVCVRRHPDRINALILSSTSVPIRQLAPAKRLLVWIARALPWSVATSLLRKPLIKVVDPSGEATTFWTAYLDELLASRLTKADLLSNLRIQHDYYRRFHFMPQDLENWPGKILIAESDTDVLGPRLRQALRQTYPNAEVRTFHNGGHGTMFLRFDEYLAMVRQFLDSVI
ncbi:MAG: alpha/beta hydrolase [Bryobacteraceae bacterium]